MFQILIEDVIINGVQLKPNANDFKQKFMQLEHEWLCQFDKLTRKQAAEEIKNMFNGITTNAFKRNQDTYFLYSIDLIININLSFYLVST